MSLVDYQSSSEDSDGEIGTESGKFPPKSSTVIGQKKKEPVKITVPSVTEFEEEVDESPCKKLKLKESHGLLGMLPAPRYSGVTAKATLLVPHSVSKEKKVSSQKPQITSSTKSAVIKTITTEIKDSDKTEVSSSNFFSIESNPAKSTTVETAADAESSDNAVSSSSDFFSLGDSAQPTVRSSMFLGHLPEPKGNVSSYSGGLLFLTQKSAEKTTTENKDIAISSSSMPDYGNRAVNENENISSSNATYSNVSNSSDFTYPDVDSQFAQGNEYISTVEPSTEAESSYGGNSHDFVNDERFLRLQGKKMRGMEDVNIIDINADSLVASRTEWHTKSISEEKKATHSRKKNDMPTQLQRRKHQITYLAFQAKERELDLKNQWAQNKLTKQQTQAKYGF